jgi:hypothetical protein
MLEIQGLVHVWKNLLTIHTGFIFDSIKDKKNAYKHYNEKEKIINDMITILADGDSA